MMYNTFFFPPEKLELLYFSMINLNLEQSESPKDICENDQTRRQILNRISGR